MGRSVEQKREPRNKFMYLQSIFDKRGKNIQWNKDSFFNKWCWEKLDSHIYKKKIRTFTNTT